MIKFFDCKNWDAEVALVELMADTKAEVTANGDTYVPGMPKGRKIAFGSYCLTVDGEVGIIDSEGTWHWVGDDSNSRSIASPLRSEKAAPVIGEESGEERRESAEPIDEIPEEEEEPKDDMR